MIQVMIKSRILMMSNKLETHEICAINCYIHLDLLATIGISLMKYQVDCYDLDNLLLCNNYHFI